MITRRLAVAAAAGAPLLARGAWAEETASAPATTVAAEGPPKPHSFDELLRDPIVKDAAISPDGQQLAVLRTQTKGDKTRSYVALNKIAELDAKPHVVELGEYQVDQVEWAKNDRLLIWIVLWKDSKGRPYGFDMGGFIFPIPLRRVISIGFGGDGGVFLFADNKTVMHRAFDAATIVDTMQDDPSRVLMQAWDTSRKAASLYHVDVYTGHAELVEKGPAATDFWLTQRGVPMLRLDSNSRNTVVSIFGRAPGETDWKLIRKTRRDEFKKLPEFDVVGPTPQAGVFLIRTQEEGRDTKTLRTFDLRTLEFGETIATAPGRDVEAAIIDEGMNLVATASRDDRLEYQFTDPGLAAHMRAVNGALKNVCNVRIYDISLDHKRLLLRTTGPREPGAFHLYDREAKRLHLISVTRPWLEPSRLAAMEALKIKTRDGAQITAYLSTPPGAPQGPLPMVVLPHGGPEERDNYDFDLFTQALAAQGWLVLQPNFRGSSGYGKAFTEAGHKRWGDRMQQDVEDAVAHVVALRRADPKRLAIMGGSYGGYAALMGPILQPELYRCAVSLAGVSDLPDMLKHEREDGEDSPSFKYWVSVIGDPKADADLLQKASPRLRAAEFRVPVLLIHGTADSVVPARQSKMMADALKAAGKTFEHKELPGEGHNGWSDANAKLILETATGFIRKYI